MSYSNNPYNNVNRNVTMIDSLPELKDIESPEDQSYSKNLYIRGFNPASDIIPSEFSNKYQKVIRGNHVPPRESGMEARTRVNYIENNYRVNKNVNKNINNINLEQPYDEDDNNYDNNYDDNRMQPNNYRYINCIEIANHIKNCPICSKLYGSTDKIFYIVVIIFLLIICLILLKNIINK